MARQMVIPRKGSAVADDASESDTADDGSSDSDNSPDSGDSDVVECPNCKCEFNENTLDVVKPGLKVQKPMSEEQGQPQGADLDVSDSAEPTPGKFGTARDAAVGQEASTGDLASVLHGMLSGGR